MNDSSSSQTVVKNTFVFRQQTVLGQCKPYLSKRGFSQLQITRNKVVKTFAPILVTRSAGTPSIPVQTTRSAGTPSIPVQTTRSADTPSIPVKMTRLAGAPSIPVQTTRSAGTPSTPVLTFAILVIGFKS